MSLRQVTFKPNGIKPSDHFRMKQAYRKKSQNIKTMFNSVSIIQMMNGAACSVFEVVSRPFDNGTVPVSVTRVSVKR